MISLIKCTGSCNVLSPKKCVPKETKDINVKAYNMITNRNVAKALREHISCECKCKFSSTAYNSKQKWNNKTFQCECKNYRKFKENYRWNRSTNICDKYFAHSFISDYINIDNYYYLLSLCKTERYNIKWKKAKLKKFVLKIVRVISSMT